MHPKTNRAVKLPFAVAEICFGTSPLGDMPDTYGYGVDAERARQTLHSIFQLDPCFLDTSRNYGMGRSEDRIGAVIAELGGLPAHAVISTKLDRDMDTGRFDGDRARRSLEESLHAMGLNRVQILHLHDPEYARELSEVTQKGGAIDTLFRMKEEGLVSAVGLAMGRLDLMQQLLADWDFDALISHNRFGLLNREADSMFSTAHARGIAVFNAAPYAGGMLAKGSASGAKVTYQDATPEQRATVERIEAICSRHRIPLGAAALQFSMRDPRITSTIVGVSKPERVQQTLRWAAHPILPDAWAELLALPYSTDDPEATRVYIPT